MEGPRPWGTALWITVSPVPGKYALAGLTVPRSRRSPGIVAGGRALTQRGTPFPAVWRPPGKRQCPAGSGLAGVFQRFELRAVSVCPEAVSGQAEGRWSRGPMGPGQRGQAIKPIARQCLTAFVKKRPKEMSGHTHPRPAC